MRLGELFDWEGSCDTNRRWVGDEEVHDLDALPDLLRVYGIDDSNMDTMVVCRWETGTVEPKPDDNMHVELMNAHDEHQKILRDAEEGLRDIGTQLWIHTVDDPETATVDSESAGMTPDRKRLRCLMNRVCALADDIDAMMFANS